MEHSSSSVYRELQCSKDRIKPSDSSAHWRERRTMSEEQSEEGKRKIQNRMLGEKKQRLVKGATLTMSQWALQQHSYLPKNKLDGQTWVTASGKGTWPAHSHLHKFHATAFLSDRCKPSSEQNLALNHWLPWIFLSLPLNSSSRHHMDHCPSAEVFCIGRSWQGDGWYCFMW